MGRVAQSRFSRWVAVVGFVLVNAMALFCVLNPWRRDWESQGLVLLAVEAAALVLIGVPVFVHHRRKGLGARAALAESLDTILSFLVGWV